MKTKPRADSLSVHFFSAMKKSPPDAHQLELYTLVERLLEVEADVISEVESNFLDRLFHKKSALGEFSSKEADRLTAIWDRASEAIVHDKSAYRKQCILAEKTGAFVVIEEEESQDEYDFENFMTEWDE